MIQEFINKQFYNLFIFTFIFGLVLYGTIGFDSIDEICACILLILFIFATFKTPDWAINKSFLAVSSVFIFYTIYSFYIHSNSAKGIISDMIIQFKPYLAFFTERFDKENHSYYILFHVSYRMCVSSLSTRLQGNCWACRLFRRYHNRILPALLLL